jgi:hypothetical protein
MVENRNENESKKYRTKMAIQGSHNLYTTKSIPNKLFITWLENILYKHHLLNSLFFRQISSC